MNKKITRLARAAKCGGRAASGRPFVGPLQRLLAQRAGRTIPVVQQPETGTALLQWLPAEDALELPQLCASWRPKPYSTNLIRRREIRSMTESRGTALARRACRRLQRLRLTARAITLDKAQGPGDLGLGR